MVGLYNKFLRCKFSDPRSIFARSNDIIAKNLHFSVKSAGLQLSRSGAQIMIDSDKQQNEKMRNETVDLEYGLRFHFRSTV